MKYILIVLFSFIMGGMQLVSAGYTIGGEKKTRAIPGAESTIYQIATGDTIGVYYVGTIDDGRVFDTNIKEIFEGEDALSGVITPIEHFDPLIFTVGDGQMMPGFDRSMVGKSKGEAFSFTIMAADAYGEVYKNGIVEFPLELFKGFPIQVGSRYPLTDKESGVVYSVLVREIGSEKVLVDFNHQLAGEDLHFTVTIDSVTRQK